MRLYQVNLPGGPVMVFAHTIQRAWIMAFTRYAYDCDPDPAFAWDATEEWLAASDGQQAHTRTTLDDMEEGVGIHDPDNRSEEHTSELQSLMRISYAVFCLKKKKNT